MTGRWFRVYDDLLNNAKLQKLSAETFRGTLNCWCIASKHDGKLPPLEEVAFMLRMAPKKAADLLNELEAAGLLDNVDGKLTPHNWSSRQYKSDTSNERVQRHRQRKRNATCNVTGNDGVTPPEQTQIQIEDSRSVADATRPIVDDPFDRFYRAYPKRDGANPRKPAKAKFEKLVRNGADPEAIIAGATRYADELAGQNKLNTVYVAQANTWLNQERWRDTEPTKPTPAATSKVFLTEDDPRHRAWEKYLIATRGRGPFMVERESDRKRGSYFDSDTPPPLPNKTLAA